MPRTLKLILIFASIIVGFTVAAILGRVDFSGVAAAPGWDCHREA